MLRGSEAFQLLHPTLLNVIQKYGYLSPTPVQRKAIRAILEGRNTIISAPTGSGKTEAALFPIFSKMLGETGWTGVPYMVYITPTRALNRDIFIRMREISTEVGLRSIVRHGDSSRRERRDFNEGNYHWFITTPESFSMLITHPASRDLLKGIRWVVVDEVHELIDSERGSSLSLSLERLRRKSGSFQFIAISATIPKVELVKKLFSCPDCVWIKDDSKKSINIEVHSIPIEDNEGQNEDRIKYIILTLRKIIESSRNAIIFTNTRDTAEFLTYKFRELGYNDLEVHHGSLSTEMRTNVERGLKNGSLKGVIATSSLELGIDIGSVDLVVQYGSPRQVLRLAQRVGRSGHTLGRESRGVIFSPNDLFDMLESLVIARRTVSGKFEDLSLPSEPLDVLLHQVVGIILGGEARTAEGILEIIQKSYPFRNTSKETVEKVLEFASAIGLLRITEKKEVLPGRRSRGYYFSTTMIPDTRKIDVYTVAGERVGTLDAEFVFSKLEEESTFILSGREWRVVSIEDDKLVVEEVEEHRGLPPSWLGDLIPVSRWVAREAIALLRRICFGESIEKVRADYPAITDTVYDNVKKVCRDHMNDFLVPHHEHVILEEGESILVIHVALGTKGNFALSSLLSKYIASHLGKRVQIQSDAYKLFIDTSAGLDIKDIESSLYALASFSDFELEEMLRDSLKNSNAFNYRMIQVARKMGALGENYSLKDSKKILRYYRDTVIGEEALREIIFEKTELSSVLSLLTGLRNGRIKIHKQPKKGLSPITIHSTRGEMPISYSFEAIPQEIGIRVLEKRIMEKEVILKCLSCGHETRRKVKDLPDSIICEKCGSKAIAPIPLGNAVFLNAVRAGLSGKRLQGKDREYFEDAVRRANLVISHGKIAVIALTPYGVGPKAASRALSKLKLGWNEFLKALYDEERNFIKNRKYWD
ncbi:MAG TPA: DEAD/DEAH box helicase [Fervidicoccus fontis]|uniref:DEAD/DEAH box helicase n=1 Tax=Fervidicoccus fontis TaxID=683846 RepID=A0A7C2US06_9CREN|nr:DEAD/DEAH box helicase [Fervidicoccus fontis]